MSLESDFRSYLLADSNISALVGTRIYGGKLPQDVTYPAISYARISGERVHKLTGAGDRAVPRIQYDCWAESYTGAKALADLLRQRLNGASGTIGSTVVGMSRLDGEREFYDDGGVVHRVSLDFFVSYQET